MSTYTHLIYHPLANFNDPEIKYRNLVIGDIIIIKPQAKSILIQQCN